MSEELIVKHCAPTLAGLKTANMFSCRYDDKSEIKEDIKNFNRRMVKKGICLIPLRMQDGRALIYLYRPDKLRVDLKNHSAEKMLSSFGYNISSPALCIRKLITVLRAASDPADFPHEIGFFLGYPPEDVVGFINNHEGCKLVGTWKVYGDEESARRKFSLYQKCTKLYAKAYSGGRSLEQLAVRTAV